jgi:hypothetical protein
MATLLPYEGLTASPDECETFSEPERDRVLDDVVFWITTRL